MPMPEKTKLCQDVRRERLGSSKKSVNSLLISITGKSRARLAPMHHIGPCSRASRTRVGKQPGVKAKRLARYCERRIDQFVMAITLFLVNLFIGSQYRRRPFVEGAPQWGGFYMKMRFTLVFSPFGQSRPSRRRTVMRNLCLSSWRGAAR
jgi:hypothetical protein